MDKPPQDPPEELTLPPLKDQPGRDEPSPFEYGTIHVPRHVDERCFTWCSQNSPRRVSENPPTCHTLCWRKIRPHEQEITNVFQRLLQAKFDISSLQDIVRQYSEPGLPKEEVQRRVKGGFDQMRRETVSRRLAYEADHHHHDRRVTEGMLVEIGMDVRQVKRPLESLGRNIGEMEKTIRLLDELYDKVKGKAHEEGMGPGMVDYRTSLTELKRTTLHVILELYRSGKSTPELDLGELVYMTELDRLHYPFPSTAGFSFLRGHYLYYSRHHQNADARMKSMQHIGQPTTYEAMMQAMKREGRSVSWMIDNASYTREMAAEDGDTRYEALVSVEHIPPMLIRTFLKTVVWTCMPATRSLDTYLKSFVSGHQSRSMSMFWDRVWDVQDGPLGTLRKMGDQIERWRKGER